MAKFKLSLIQILNGQEIEIPFTNFNSNIQKLERDQEFYYPNSDDNMLFNTYSCLYGYDFSKDINTNIQNEGIDKKILNTYSSSYDYSFNEHVSFHKNAQAELNFSMLKYVTLESVFSINPFATILKTGSIIKLEDQFNVVRYFWVNNISYNFTKINIEYSFSCQDVFSYLNTRKNNGYEIHNDPNDQLFIGSKTIDEWAEKIVNECGMLYHYVNLLKGNHWSYDEAKKWNRNIMFSLSSSNAFNALVSLAEQAGLIIEVNENNNKKEFWFKPEKNPHFNGLLYSPYSDIKSFGLSQSGDNLVSVLNVYGQEIADNQISLLQYLPEDLLLKGFSSEQWASSLYYPGFYTDITGPRLIIPGTDHTITEEEEKNILKLKNDYNNTEDDNIMEDIESTMESNYELYWNIPGFKEDFENKESTLYEYFPLRLEIWKNIKDTTGLEEGEFRLIPQKSTTIQAFLNVVDNIPWLENKIINIEYFYYNHLLTKDQYDKVWGLLTNNLRIANGLMLYYSYLYNNSLRTTNQILLTLETQTDQYGADYLAHIVNKIENESEINWTQLGKLPDEDYKALVTSFIRMMQSNQVNAKLIDYVDLISDYGSNLVRSEQIFLKNMYAFQTYRFDNGLTWAQDTTLESMSIRDIQNLTGYWQAACNVTWNCSYYLPENWQKHLFKKEQKGENKEPKYYLNQQNFEMLIPIVDKQFYMIKEKRLYNSYSYVKGTASIDPLENTPAYNDILKQYVKSGYTWIGKGNPIEDSWYFVSKKNTDQEEGQKKSKGLGLKWDAISSQIQFFPYEGYKRPTDDTTHKGPTNGRNALLLYLLLNRYMIDDNNWKQEYNNAVANHNVIWGLIYDEFNNILLEQEYKDDSAIDCEELYKNAQNYFKDISNPEYQYNLSIININNLKGYKGDRINISDQIQLAADEFYGEVDDLKHLIRQPLFIADISYDLRSDEEIQLTVNTVKYQDKVIQRLVSLIK